jgi:LPXTG-site transpeptidase (sortase) family protein
MATESDTLNIGSLRLQKEYPMADIHAPRQLDPVLHPDAAAAARAKIAAIPDAVPVIQVDKIPATPTADLITNKSLLAKQVTSEPVIKRRSIPSALTPLLTAIGIFAIVLLLFKAPIIISQVEYALQPHPTTPAATDAAAAASAVVPAGNTISIPKINVQAPVEYINTIQETAIEDALENGVVHYSNTALPGQDGNVAIFGHSSNDWWQPGNFKFVFVLLDKLSPGDLVTINYQSKQYIYQVTGSQIVAPTDMSVLNPTSTPTLSLITCTPPGTSLNRLVVTAKQIEPAPNTATPVQATPAAPAGSSLPSSAPSFLTEASQAWNGVVDSFESLFGAGNSSSSTTSPSPAAGASQLPAAN